MRRYEFASALVATALISGGAFADPASDVEAVKAADLAFYTALSAMDAKAMAAVWADKPYVTNISPVSKAVAVGNADAVTKFMATVIAGRYSELRAQKTSIASVQVNGNVAWVVGTAHVNGKSKAGDAVSFDVFVTDIFEKDDGKWLMVAKHAQALPQ